jgi:hypothetical protein
MALSKAEGLRYPQPSPLRRTSMYASFLGILEALHMDIFHQPLRKRFFDSLFRICVTFQPKFFGLSGECRLALPAAGRPGAFQTAKALGVFVKKSRAVSPAFLLMSKVSIFVKNRLRHHKSSPVLAVSPIDPPSTICTQRPRLALSPLKTTSPLHTASSFFPTSTINTDSSIFAGSFFRNILVMGNLSSLNSRAPTTPLHPSPVLTERQHIVSEPARSFS